MIQTIFDNTTKFTVNYDNRLNNFTKETIEHNKKRIHTEIVRNYERSKQPNQVINDRAPEINKYNTIQYNRGLIRPFRRREATSGTARTRARIAGERAQGVSTGSQDPGVSQGKRRGS